MDIREKLEQYGRPLAVGLVVIVAIIGISVASNNDNDSNTDSNEATTGEVAENENETTTDESSENTPEGAESTDDQAGDEPEAGPVEVESTDDGYTATARQGDNQTVIVRQIISEYATANDLELNGAQRVYAETLLVNELGRDDTIAVDYVAQLSNEQVKAVVDNANSLSDAEQALWAQYL